MSQYGKANFDKPKYENERTPIYKITASGKNIVRELTLRFAPPMKELRDNPKGYRKMHSVHWGYGYTVQKKDGSDVFLPQNFECIREYDANGNITQECPECESTFRVRDEVERLTQKMKADGVPAEQITAALKPKTDWLFKHSKDRKAYWIAKDQSGKWGHCLLPKETSQLLETKLAELQSKGIDALAPENGLWFRIYAVDQKTKNVEVVMEHLSNGTMKYKTDSFTDADDQALEKIAGLTQVTTKISLDQVRALVDSKGNEDIARTIFSKGRPSRNSQPMNSNVAPGFEMAPATPAPAVLVESYVPQTTVEATTTTTPTTPAATTAANANISVEELLSMYNVKV